jgi:hypothetical protein
MKQHTCYVVSEKLKTSAIEHSLKPCITALMLLATNPAPHTHTASGSLTCFVSLLQATLYRMGTLRGCYTNVVIKQTYMRDKKCSPLLPHRRAANPHHLNNELAPSVMASSLLNIPTSISSLPVSTSCNVNNSSASNPAFFVAFVPVGIALSRHRSVIIPLFRRLSHHNWHTISK